MKLALGTAQFGSSYGIVNQFGMVNFQNVKEIIELAREKKIDLIDTAIAYGDSEKAIGKNNIFDFNVVTKLPPVPENTQDVKSWVENKVNLSLSNLGLRNLYGLLIHNSESLTGNSGKELINSLNVIKSKGLVKKIGISIYDPYELDFLMHLMKIDIVQVPFSIIDQRIETSGWLDKLYQAKVEVYARSVFLQGLLLLPQNNLPSKFNRWNYFWKKWHEWLNDNKLTALEATIKYALSIPKIKRVIVGVETKKQLKQITDVSGEKLPRIPSELSLEDTDLLCPFNWHKL